MDRRTQLEKVYELMSAAELLQDECRSMLLHAATFGQIFILDWLAKNQPKFLTLETIEQINVVKKAVFYGRLNVLEWLENNVTGLVIGTQDADIMLIAMLGAEETFIWFHQRYYREKSTDQDLHNWVACAAVRGLINVLEYLCSKITNPQIYEMNFFVPLRNALSNNQIHCANWLQKVRPLNIAELEKMMPDTTYLSRPAMSWLFDRVPRGKFDFQGQQKWDKELQQRKNCVLMLILGGQRRRWQLPPEIWEQCVQPLLCGVN